MAASHFSTLVKDNVKYNAWANKTLIEFLRTKPSELMEKTVPSSFPSIRLTFDHIMQTERFWLSVIQKKAIRAERYVSTGTLDEIFSIILNTSQELADFVEGLGDEELAEEVLFTSPWAESTSPRFKFINQATTHSSYHRGQIITIGRNLGFTDAPMTDYNYYLMTQHSLAESN